MTDNKQRFVYYENTHPYLRNQLDMLEEHGFIKNVTAFGKNTPVYRMTEKLITAIGVKRLD